MVCGIALYFHCNWMHKGLDVIDDNGQLHRGVVDEASCDWERE